jgi:Dolichyl-phosphate-mannose-protein mannosyltransferase
MTARRTGRAATEPGAIDRLGAVVALPVAVALALAGQYLLTFKDWSVWRSVLPGVLLYAAAILLVVRTWGRGRAAPAAGPTPPWRPRALPAGVEYALVALLLLSAFYLRVYRIDLIPWGLNNDEAINALETQEIAAGRPFATLTERGLNRETMFHYLAVLSFRNPGLALNLLRSAPGLFGLQPLQIDDELMDLVFPLRFVSIAVGVLTVLALYLLARDRFGRRVAFLAALFLTVSPWHLLYSRVGLRAILEPLFALATVGFFLRALQSGRLRDHLGWGCALGLGFWSYTSFRAVPLALAVFLLLYRVIDPQRAAALWRARRPLLAGAGVALVLGVAIAALSGVGPIGFLMRGAYATLPPKSSLWRNLLSCLILPNYTLARYAVIQSDAFISDGVSAVFGLIGLEPVTMVMGALATLGLFEAVRRARMRPRDATCVLVLLCVAALILTVGLTGPSLTRMLPNLPWFCLLAALFVWRLFDVVAAWRPPLGVILAAVMVAGLATLDCAQGFSHYFLRAGRSEQAMQHFGANQTIMGMFVRAQPEGMVIDVLHTLRVDTLTYLIGPRPDVHLISNPTRAGLDALTREPRTTMFVIENSRPFAEPFRYLITRFPQGDATKVGDIRFDPDTVIFYTFTVYKDAQGNPIPAPGSADELGLPGLPGAPPGDMSFPDPTLPPR